MLCLQVIKFLTEYSFTEYSFDVIGSVLLALMLLSGLLVSLKIWKRRVETSERRRDSAERYQRLIDAEEEHRFGAKRDSPYAGKASDHS